MKRIPLFTLTIVLLLTFAMLTNGANALVTTRIYTLDADFDEGTLVGVEHETVHDQLQLSREITTLPFIWVPNNDGSVSKFDTGTGKELGRYLVSAGSDSSPSRTTVDLQGNCWVGCRQRGTVVKIGLLEAGQWIDRNSNGVPDTSRDLNNDGDINEVTEMYAWGQDECVLYEVVLIDGKQGTFIPGTYAAGYDTNYWGTAPRGLAVDANNNLWAGTWSSRKYYYIDGATGAILRTVDVAAWNHNSYGAVIDANGILWSSTGPSGAIPYKLLSMDPSTDPATISQVTLTYGGSNRDAYGLGLDQLGHLFAVSYYYGGIFRINTATATIDWYKAAGLNYARGVACTGDNDIWVASSGGDTVQRYDNDGNWEATIAVGNEPTGVAVDAVGKVWACDNLDENIKRIDPATNTVDLTKTVVGSSGHYSYSDMTGIVVRSITTKTGTWTVIFDSQGADTPWGIISWTSLEPVGTSVAVRARSSNDQVSWSGWSNAVNGVPLLPPLTGRYIEIECTLRIVAGDISPILYDLTVNALPEQVIPEVPFGTVMILASMTIALVAYIAIPKVKARR